jgi:hypothetical protein
LNVLVLAIYFDKTAEGLMAQENAVDRFLIDRVLKVPVLHN